MNTKRLFVSFIISLAVVFLAFFISNDFGIVWDEPIYFRNADEYVSWFKKPVFNDIEKSFHPTVTDAHPPFRKIVAGLTHDFFTKKLPILDNTRAYRVSYVFFAIPFVMLFAYVAIGRLGYAIGISCAILYSLSPHILFMTPLVTMDYAIVSTWFMAVITTIVGIKKYPWLIISAICVGLTMLMKLHGFLLFVPVGLFFLWHFLSEKKPTKNYGVLFKFILYILIAFGTYIIGWPWLWTHTIERLGIYFQIQLDHSNIPVYVLGQTYSHAPWWYVPLSFVTSIPVMVLVFFMFGVIEVYVRKKEFEWVMLLNALYPMIFFSLPWIYRYDWMRLFLPSYPFVYFVAGYGVVRCIRMIRRYRERVLVALGVVLLTLLTIFTSVIRIHPWESSYYSELVGGIPGAFHMGFETEYWGNSYLAVLPWMNIHKNEMMCVWPTTHPFYYYQAMGMIESGVVFNAAQDACKYAIVLMRQGLFGQNAFIEQLVKNKRPIYSITSDSTVLVGVYDTEK